MYSIVYTDAILYFLCVCLRCVLRKFCFLLFTRNALTMSLHFSLEFFSSLYTHTQPSERCAVWLSESRNNYTLFVDADRQIYAKIAVVGPHRFFNLFIVFSIFFSFGCSIAVPTCCILPANRSRGICGRPMNVFYFNSKRFTVLTE